MSDSPAPTTTSEVLPMTPEEITSEWLSEKLGHKIKSIEQTRSIWGTETKLFYTVTYEHEEEKDDDSKERPTTICIKGIFDPKMAQAMPWTIGMAQREAEFFEKIAPRIEGVVMPRSYWSGTNEKQGIVIMNDLDKEGCTYAQEVANYPVDMLRESVEQLARLHAKFWGQSEKEEPWIWNNYDPSILFVASGWKDRVNDPGRHELPDYLKDSDRCLLAVKRYFAERNPRFRTLLHGDPHIGNVYFTKDGHIGFLDWSAIHFGSCFHDLAYHITALLSIEDRRQYEFDLLDRYLTALHQYGGPKFDRHNDPEVMIEYRRSFMTNTAWIICPFGLQSMERINMLCERTVATYDDHKVIDVILNQPVKETEEKAKSEESTNGTVAA